MAKKKQVIPQISESPKIQVPAVVVPQVPKIKVLAVVPAVHVSHVQYRESVVAAVNAAIQQASNTEVTFDSTEYAHADDEVTVEQGWNFVVTKFNAAVNRFLSGNYDYLWMVEADVIVPQNALSRLLGDNVDCASAVIPYHFQNYRPEIQFKDLVICGFFAPQPSFENYNLKLPQIKDKLLVGSKEHPIFAGTGCILFTRKLFADGLRFHWDPKVCGFDVYFWLDIQRLGFSAVVDGFVVCEHPGA